MKTSDVQVQETTASIWDIVAHLKDVASIVTPFLIAAVGLRINSTVQMQNKIADRQSALITKWADKFSELVNDIDGAANKILLMYYEAAHPEEFLIGDKEKYIHQFNIKARKIALSMESYKINLDNYVKLAPRTGRKLAVTFEELHVVCSEWFSNNGGNPVSFLNIRSRFNEGARDTHREILRLDDKV